MGRFLKGALGLLAVAAITGGMLFAMTAGIVNSMNWLDRTTFTAEAGTAEKLFSLGFHTDPPRGVGVAGDFDLETEVGIPVAAELEAAARRPSEASVAEATEIVLAGFRLGFRDTAGRAGLSEVQIEASLTRLEPEVRQACREYLQELSDEDCRLLARELATLSPEERRRATATATALAIELTQKLTAEPTSLRL